MKMLSNKIKKEEYKVLFKKWIKEVSQFNTRKKCNSEEYLLIYEIYYNFIIYCFELNLIEDTSEKFLKSDKSLLSEDEIEELILEVYKKTSLKEYTNGKRFFKLYDKNNYFKD